MYGYNLVFVSLAKLRQTHTRTHTLMSPHTVGNLLTGGGDGPSLMRDPKAQSSYHIYIVFVLTACTHKSFGTFSHIHNAPFCKYTPARPELGSLDDNARARTMRNHRHMKRTPSHTQTQTHAHLAQPATVWTGHARVLNLLVKKCEGEVCLLKDIYPCICCRSYRNVCRVWVLRCHMVICHAYDFWRCCVQLHVSLFFVCVCVPECISATQSRACVLVNMCISLPLQPESCRVRWNGMFWGWLHKAEGNTNMRYNKVNNYHVRCATSPWRWHKS